MCSTIEAERGKVQEARDAEKKEVCCCIGKIYKGFGVYWNLSSAACLRTAEEATDRFAGLSSDTARKNAVKEQIRMRVIGFGWIYMFPGLRMGVTFQQKN